MQALEKLYKFSEKAIYICSFMVYDKREQSRNLA